MKVMITTIQTLQKRKTCSPTQECNKCIYFKFEDKFNNETKVSIKKREIHLEQRQGASFC